MVGAGVLWLHHAAAASAPTSPHGCVRPVTPGEARSAAPRPNLTSPTALRSEVAPAVVWYDATHPNSVAIAAEVLAVVERSWDVQVRQIGFRAPVLPDAADGPELDVYLADYQPFGAFVSPDDVVDDVPGDGFNGTSTFVVVDRELPLEMVPAWVSHEFNHVLQFATDFTEPTLPLWEGTATAAQDWTVGAQGRWDQQVPSFQEVPEVSVFTADAYEIWPVLGEGASYEYGAAFWVMYLDEVLVGAGPGVGAAALWEAAANEGPGREPDVVDAIAELADMSVGEVLDAFAVARVVIGDDWDARGLPDARRWDADWVVDRGVLPAADLPVADLALDPAPQILGQAFVEVDLSAGLPAAAGMAEPWLVVQVRSDAALQSGLVAMLWDEAGVGTDVDAVGEAPELAVPVGTTQRLVLAVTNLGPPGWDGDDDPYVPGDQRLTVSIEDRAPGATGTETTSSLPDADGGPKPAPSPGGCGCTTGSPPTGWLVALAGWIALTGRATRWRGARPRCAPRPGRAR